MQTNESEACSVYSEAMSSETSSETLSEIFLAETFSETSSEATPLDGDEAALGSAARACSMAAARA